VLGLFVVLIAGFVVWFGIQVTFGAFRAIEHHKSGSDEPFSAAMLGPADFAFLSTLPFIIAFLVLAIGDRFVKRDLPRELGWSGDWLGGGIWRGALAMVSVMPLMLGAGILLELLYRLVGYEHPTEHELLTVLGMAKEPLTKGLIIGGATLLAPVFEEFLFRGHVQTLLVRAFTPRPKHQSALPVVPVTAMAMSVEGGAPSVELFAPMPPLPAPPLEPRPAPVASPSARWAAIGITALLFAAMHPVWTWPLIFLLAIALGYAYERTGNLWVPVTMHLVFNTFQTAFFLLSRGGL
jgi:membrane protease YdiL (CAAX protease family)